MSFCPPLSHFSWTNSQGVSCKEICHRLGYHLCQRKASTAEELVAFIIVYLILDPTIKCCNICIYIRYSAGSAVARSSRNNAELDIITSVQQRPTGITEACLA